MRRDLQLRASLAALTAAAGVLAAVTALVVLPPAAPSVVPPQNFPSQTRDLTAIRRAGVLRVAVPEDEIAHVRYRNREEGFVYELAHELARQLDLELQIINPPSASAALRALVRGEADIAATADAGPIPIQVDVTWTSELDLTHPVVVGREAGEIARVSDLRGRRIAVRPRTVLERLAWEWRRDLDGELELVRAHPGAGDKDLAHLAASQQVPLALLDLHRAQLEAAVFEPLEVSAPLGASLPIRWALRRGDEELQDAVADWLYEIKQSGQLARVEQLYFENPLRLKSRRRPVLRMTGARISPYDSLFRREAQRHGFDWRLLAALAFAESGYDRWEVSNKGAMGLLQIMPFVADEYGAQDPFDPAQNVAAGANLLRWLYDLYDEVPEPDRLSFTLAAYNMGLAHVEDARALAAMRGLHPDRWKEGIAIVMPLLEEPAIAATLPHGRARGRVTLRYVEHVTDIFEKMLRLTDPGPQPLPTRAATLSSGTAASPP